MSSTTMTVEWLAVRRAAVSATRRGWPVVPGTFLGSDRHWHGREEATALCPVEDTWARASVTDPDQAPEIWTQQPSGVLLVCGRGVDVLQFPHRLEGLLPALAAGNLALPPTPVAHLVTARWTVPPPQGAERTPLPTAEEVQQVLLDALLHSGLPAGPDDDD